jgi:hypothetical protein
LPRPPRRCEEQWLPISIITPAAPSLRPLHFNVPPLQQQAHAPCTLPPTCMDALMHLSRVHIAVPCRRLSFAGRSLSGASASQLAPLRSGSFTAPPPLRTGSSSSSGSSDGADEEEDEEDL